MLLSSYFGADSATGGNCETVISRKFLPTCWTFLDLRGSFAHHAETMFTTKSGRYDEWPMLCDVAPDVGDETTTDPIT